MITIFQGNLTDITQLEREIVLTGQEQLALAQSIINGACVLRVHCGLKIGEPCATLEQIDCSWYDHFNTAENNTGGAIWRPCETLTLGVGSDGDLGSDIECQGPQITAPALACYPTMIRLVWSNVVLGPENWIENFKLGIMLSNAVR
jgi:hypothetical protein